jgi:hypothetical protein
MAINDKAAVILANRKIGKTKHGMDHSLSVGPTRNFRVIWAAEPHHLLDTDELPGYNF